LTLGKPFFGKVRARLSAFTGLEAATVRRTSKNYALQGGFFMGEMSLQTLNFLAGAAPTDLLDFFYPFYKNIST